MIISKKSIRRRKTNKNAAFYRCFIKLVEENGKIKSWRQSKVRNND
jgi:hypothetical protein